MLSEDAKKTIDALPKDELVQEITKKNRSRFQGDKYAYLQTRLAVKKATAIIVISLPILFIL